VLVPVYLAHRYQAEAAVKLLGGVNYTYAVRGDGQPTNEPVPAAFQRGALTLVLQTVRPHFLALPEEIIKLIPPRPPGYERDRESFESHTGVTFDPIAAAESWIDHTLSLLLNLQRLSRIVEQGARGKSDLTVREVFDAVLKTAVVAKERSAYEKELGRAVEKLALHHLLRLAINPDAQQQVAAAALAKIDDVEKGVKTRPAADPADAAHNRYLAFQIERFRDNPKDLQFPKTPKLPAGPPIGSEH
jgi:hypothetical protein